MKSYIRLFVRSFLLLISIGVLQPSVAQNSIQIQLDKKTLDGLKNNPNIKKIKTKPLSATQMRLLFKPACPDLKAEKIEFRIKSRQDRYRGVVQVIGTIKNNGRVAYESSPGLQEIFLYNNYLGTRHPVATQGFQNLSPGQEAKIIYERPWDSASPAEGEFPPTYRLMIMYNPDIYIDGNEKNNDCNWSNNSVDKSSAEVNALFR